MTYNAEEKEKQVKAQGKPHETQKKQNVKQEPEKPKEYFDEGEEEGEEE